MPQRLLTRIARGGSAKIDGDEVVAFKVDDSGLVGISAVTAAITRLLSLALGSIENL